MNALCIHPRSQRAQYVLPRRRLPCAPARVGHGGGWARGLRPLRVGGGGPWGTHPNPPLARRPLSKGLFTPPVSRGGWGWSAILNPEKVLVLKDLNPLIPMV